jgi:hypothetical protein
VRFTEVSDAVLPPLFERLSKVECTDDAAPQLLLRDILNTLNDAAQGMSSHLGCTIDQALNAYTEILGIGAEGKRTVPFYPLTLDSEKQTSGRTTPMRWVTLTAPTLPILEQVADTLGVSRSTAEMYLHGDQPPAFFRSREGCFYVFEELIFERDSIAIRNKDIFAIQNRDYLVTITRTPSDCIDQIRDEMKRQLLGDSEREFSNHLLVRVLGCSIHRNQKTLAEFTARVGQFAEQQANAVPTPETRAVLRAIQKSIDAAQRSITPMIQLLHALREDSTLYGAQPKDALHRYGALLKISESLISEARSHAKQVMDDWKLNQDNRRNAYQARWNILAAGLGPPALGLGFIEALGQGWAGGTQWSVVGVSALVSVALLIGMKLQSPKIDRVLGSGG